ncbi:TPA: hypothetical protein QH699_003066 [Providencia rettgeri]|nr:hypothetical protein [Providencia rettgeri]
MNDSVDKQRDELNTELINLKAELAEANSELDSWISYDMRREDGSGAQDRRHEEMGQRLHDQVRSLSNKIEALERTLKGLPS